MSTGTRQPGAEVSSAPATAEQVADELRAATAAAFRAASAQRQRHPHHLGISSLGGCTRRAAYALARVEPSDDPPPREGRAANLGTWEHEGLLPRLAEQLGPQAQTEVPVVLRAAGIEIPGTADLVRDPVVVEDLKTVGEHRLGRVRREGDPFYPHRMQAGGYALARLQDGHPTTWFGWHYLDRASGDEEIMVRPFTNRDALQVVDRVQTLVDWAAGDPDYAPRDERGPGLSFACDECPFLRRCWGEDAEPGQVGAQAVQVRSDADAVEQLARYLDARDRETAAKAEKKDAEAALSRTRFGTYGPVPDRPGLALEYRRDRGYQALDSKAARARLEELGEEPPTAYRQGNLRIKLVSTEGGDRR